MASVKVAVRVRPFNQRELDMGAKLIIQMDGKKTRIVNNKVPDQYKDFTFDHSYWSFNATDPHFASQEQVFGELGKDVVDAAFEGYNACVFAYGQTGSGKTFTMTGSSDNQGLIPRICESLFSRMASDVSYHTEVSYLEIYNERVKDLLHRDDGNASHNLRVREHPRHGPYVSDLSQHLVSEYSHIQELMARGNHYRTTASTNMNDTSSRSHAIFTLMFVQAGYSNDMPSETVSKVHLVDLAGSERADATGATGQRLKEGAHINKSLVTLGSVISALAELSNNSLQEGSTKKSVFIPYRDSVLTWLLKDSLGGNSKTIMIAAVSPADCNYSETLSTLRYANRAKNIINKPTVNEDPNVKLIKELRDEITKLKRMLCNGFTTESQPQMLAALQKKEAQEKVLTEKWTEKWKETQKILQEQKALGLRKFGTGVVLDSDMPHLIGIDDDLLSTGVTLYHLKEGETSIGTEEAAVKPDIILNGADIEREHCSIVLSGGVATLIPKQQAQCWVNCVLIDKPTRLSQGCNILLGRTNMFRYNDPVEAEKLRKEGSKSLLNLSRLSLLSWSTSDLAVSSENLNSSEDMDKLDVIEQQKAELVKEKEAFKLEQAEKKQDWENEQRQKREALEAAQKQLEMERQQMEIAYQEQCKRLAEDWQQLEKHQADNLATLRSKEAELDKRKQQLECERDEEMAAIHVERKTLMELQANLEKHKKHFIEFVSTSLLRCVARNNRYIKTDDKLKSLTILAAEKYCESLKTNFFSQGRNLSPEFSPSQDSHSSTPTSLCSNSVRFSSPDVSGWMNLSTVSSLLKDGIVKEIINHHKVTLANLESELRARALSVSERELRLQQIDKELQASTCDMAEETGSAKESLIQRTAEELNKISQRKQLLNLDLVPVSVSENVSTVVSPRTCDTYHTAQSPLSPVFMSDSGVGLCLEELCSTTQSQTNWADESDVSSTDDSCKSKCGTDARHRVAHYKSRNTYKLCSNNKRTEKTEILRSMKQLAQQISRQRIHIMNILEGDNDTIETNRHITILQDLKKKYIQLEKELQTKYNKGHTGSQEESDDMSTSAEETTSESVSDAVKYSTSKYTGSGLITHSSYDIPASVLQQNRNQSPPIGSGFSSVSSQHVTRVAPYNYTLARSMPALNPSLWEETSMELNVRVPTYILRGAGSATHYAYEVRLTAGGECWSVLRRYSRFRELHICMKNKYGPKIAALPFPPRRLFSRHSEWLAKERRPQLELYLQSLLNLCCEIPDSPLHRSKDNLNKFVLYELSPFFRRGIFETGKYGTA